jgi:excisionase family DNA binding protein
MEGKESPAAKTLTVDAAAKELGISRSSADEAAHRGEIPAILIGRRVLVLRRGLDDLLEGKLSRHFKRQGHSSQAAGDGERDEG